MTAGQIDSVTMTADAGSVTVPYDRFREAVAGNAADRLPGSERELATGGDPDEAFPFPAGKAFIDPASARVLDFIPAPELSVIAEALIDRFGATLGHLRDARIAYLWKRAGGSEGGKVRFGQCQKASGLVRHFGSVDFVIWLGADNCELARMTRWQVEALTFHELLHADRDEKGRPAVRPHDFEGFTKELELYGEWQSDLQRMVDAVRQLALFEDGDDA